VEAPPGLHRSTPLELKNRLDAERRGAPFLVLRDGDERQLIVELTAERSPITIGRQAASDVSLPWDDEVSRAHADVECIGDVWTLVADGRARNGTFVNGERVHGRRRLRDGDVIALGRTVLTFVEPAATDGGSTAAGNPSAPVLTAAQRRVLIALCRPCVTTVFAMPPSNRELADELYLSVETVKFHLHALFGLFGLGDVPQHAKRAALARLALEHGIVTRRELLG
jgi:pSer/pThr/pTyr-binding forkhead associated (FHA) protein